jgi:hypothetical protein
LSNLLEILIEGEDKSSWKRAYYKVEPNRLLRARLLSHAENLSNDFACISPEDRIGFYFVPEIRGSVAVAPISFEGCEWLLRLS